MSACSSKSPEQLAAWQRLGTLAQAAVDSSGSGTGVDFDASSARLGPLLVDCSKQRLDVETKQALFALAAEAGLPAAIEGLFAGAPVNVTEGRAASHTELRRPASKTEVEAERRRFLAFAESVRSGAYRGATGQPIASVLHVGIGGSHLGPELIVDALAAAATGPEVRFLANIDGHAVGAALVGLDPATTLVIVASKSFTTLETSQNAAAVKSWFLERTCDAAALGKHFVAVTANAAAARAFGVAQANCFHLWDSVGGRFSLWSAVGLPIAIALGVDAFDELLAGAHGVDEHFRTAPLDRNLPLLLALLQIWNTNFLGAASHAVLAYDRRLKRLPDYLQQLEMESNGKSVRVNGERSAIHTCPVIWGGEESNGQHAFHQLLHQGTRAFSADFIACCRVRHGHPAHHDWLLANCLAQSKALLEGRASDDAHRQAAGNHPSTTILLDELSPRALGALLALYEHKVFCAGRLWQINSFDQWGVELGKALAKPIHNALARRVEASAQDGSTAGLISAINRAR